MSDDHWEGWRHRLFLVVMAALLLSGLLCLSVKIFHETMASPAHAPNETH